LKVIYQPPLMNRLIRELQTNRTFFDKIISEWKEEQFSIVAYLEMLDKGFVENNLPEIRDLLSPERLCICLHVLGLLGLRWASDAAKQVEFWSHAPDAGLFRLLLPTLSVWGEFIEKHPGLSEQFLESESGSGFLFDIELGQAGEKTGYGRPELKEPFKKAEKKLEKTRSDLARVTEQLNIARGANDELKKKLRDCETEFEKKLADAMDRRRKEWFERYQQLDRESAGKEAGRLESLLQRTRRALELQKRADEEYGLIADIRAKLFEIDLSLKHIEAVYAGSLVVHKEVAKVKEALETERERLLKLPGIGRVIGPHREESGEIVARINLLDPVPLNLPKINRLSKMAGTLGEIGLISDPARMEEALRHKRRQILERLYSQFEPKGLDPPHEPRFLDDFVASGRSRGYELFIDGYNVLLRALGTDEHSRAGFAQFRQQFIEAVAARSRSFAKVYLVFDGVEDSRDTLSNMEVIYTDKNKRSADAVIIEKISSGKGKKILLVTGDEGIISSVQGRIFALINAVDFYMFVFE